MTVVISNIIKAVAYCRISTSSTDQENSLENQKSYFEREIAKNPNYKFVRIYSDKGISGTTLNRREEFKRMLYDAGLNETVINAKKAVYTADPHREPLFHRIFVKNTSRFARNVLVIDILRELLKKGVHVYFLDIDLLFDSVDKEFLLKIFLNFSQQESIDKSAKVRFGIREGARKGNIFVSTRIYGYVYDTQLARNKYDTGVVFNKKSTPQLRDKSEWNIFEDRIPAIVSRELFDEANNIRSSKVNHINQKGIYKGVSDFAGKIFCSKCGKPYTRNIDRGRAFYNCSTKKTKGTTACNAKNVNQENIFKQIDGLRENGLITVFARQKDKHAVTLRNKIDELQKSIDAQASEQLDVKRGELNAIEGEDETLVRLVVKGQVKESLFEELKADIDERKKIVLSQIERLSQTNENIYEEIDAVEERIRKLEALTVKAEYSRNEIIDLITRFVISENEDGHPVLTFELGVFEDLAQI